MPLNVKKRCMIDQEMLNNIEERINVYKKLYYTMCPTIIVLSFDIKSAFYSKRKN